MTCRTARITSGSPPIPTRGQGRGSRSTGARRPRASAGRSSAPCRGRGDRNVIGTPRRLLCALSRARGLVRRARPDPPARPHQHHPAATIGPFPQWTEPQPHRLARSLGPSGRRKRSRRRSPKASTSGRASPSPGRGSTCSRSRDAVAAGRLKRRRHARAAERQPVGRQGRDRPGLVSARHRRALRRHRDERCAARCSSRPAACSPSW